MRTSSTSADPRESRIDAGALSVGALEYGDPEAPPVLMTHGLAESAWSLDLLARALAEDHRVISLDLRGHGRSDWGAYTLVHFVGDLVGVCEALELVQPVVIGHSLGGQAIAQLCGLFPDLPRAAVLIEALGPPPRTKARTDPDGHEREWTRMRVELVRRQAQHRAQSDLDAAVERFLRAHPLLDPARGRFLVEKNTKELVDGSREWRHDPECRDWLAGHDHGRAEQRWGGVSCPVQILLGNDSWDTFWSKSLMQADDLEGPMSPEEMARRVGLFANATLVQMEGAGHMIHYDCPDDLETVVASFVRGLPALP